ncbi:MAG TPA: hypothetical protein VHY91_19350 [Pirellulales bacterium]|jgi:hypothetical protein|nr:hypothetical protein [Pirellulales bacterium]
MNACKKLSTVLAALSAVLALLVLAGWLLGIELIRSKMNPVIDDKDASFLQKPFDPDMLLETVRQVLDREAVCATS